MNDINNKQNDRKHQPVNYFSRENRAARFWACFFAFCLVVLIGQYHFISKTISMKQRIVIIDAARDVHITRVMPFEESEGMIHYLACLATNARLERNYKGLENQILFEQLFLPKALKHAKDEIDRDKTFFEERKIEQKCIIEKDPIITKRNNNNVMVRVYGKLLRKGRFKERPFAQQLEFRLDLHLIRNPYLKRKGRMPLAVFRYQFKTRLSQHPSSGASS